MVNTHQRELRRGGGGQGGPGRPLGGSWAAERGRVCVLA
uniref:Uncharacterized protein n=1 Tax=Siphoviridae sp. ctRGj11 TaxID=2827868 RepID=A0A8S5SJV0_9CAUD|nr:MAG TPA: hypothetical protein [Siphoviridae sp. ctRGj11]